MSPINRDKAKYRIISSRYSIHLFVLAAAYRRNGRVWLLDGKRGIFTAEQAEARINPADDPHQQITRVISIENTCNKGGGAVFPLDEIRRIRALCDRYGLSLHLDGARLFNAMVAAGTKPADYGELFDTISICLSKGLGAPVGSLLLSTQDKIHKAHRVRKVFGGGMRQAGYLAAAGLYALEHHVDRMAEDHRKAAVLGAELEKLPFVETLYPVETNILVFKLVPSANPAHFLDHLKQNGVLAVPFGGQYVRYVTHLDVSEEMLSPILDASRSFKA